MRPRPCLTCRRPMVGPGTRHASCATRQPNRTAQERQRRATTVAAHRERHGEVCPGWNRPPHPTSPDNPLTADHVDAVAAGGAEDGPLQVLCRRCNSGKRDR
jgi:5-methylcytosine-specific restriction protein A